MNEIKMEERTEIEAICELVVNEIFEIKTHICNERYFEGGFGLGGLLSSVANRQVQEENHRRKNEKVQKEKCDEECEESSEEEDEDEFNESRLVQELRKDIAESAHGKMKLIAECSEKDSQLNGLKTLLMDLQDLFIQLLAHKRINKLDIPQVVELLRRSGIDKSDLKVRAGQSEES